MIGRLSRRDDFQALRRNGEMIKKGSLRVLYRAATDPGDGPRVAFSVSRTFGTAVVRNRLRRRIRMVMTDIAKQPEGLPSGDYLILVSRSEVELSSEVLRNNLMKVIGHLQEKTRKVL